jgi:hypothetical protein
LQPSYEQLPPSWGSGWVHARALFYLDQVVSSSHHDLILKRLIEAFPVLDDLIEQEVADLLLRVTFLEKHFQFQPHMTFDDLDPIQQAVLRTLLTRNSLWYQQTMNLEVILSEGKKEGPASILSPHSPWVLAHVGLPSTQETLQAFLTTNM